MSTTTLAGLRAVLAQLKLGSIPPFRDSKVLVRPIDVYRAYLAADLHRLLKNFDVGPDAAYDCIQLSSGLENGDMDVVLRRLRLAGVDADALAIELVRQVCLLWKPVYMSSGLSHVRVRLTEPAVPAQSSLRRPFPGRLPHPHSLCASNHRPALAAIHPRARP